MTFGPELASQLVFAFFVALIGALVGGAVRWGGTRRERRLRLTLELYSEFHSPAFNHVRIAAHEALERAAAMPAAYAGAQGEARDAISSIVHFWEKAALLARIHAVDIHLMRRFLGQYALWWRALLCDKAPAALADPEWGATLTDIQWLFDKLARAPRGGARR